MTSLAVPSLWLLRPTLARHWAPQSLTRDGPTPPHPPTSQEPHFANSPDTKADTSQMSSGWAGPMLRGCLINNKWVPLKSDWSLKALCIDALSAGRVTRYRARPRATCGPGVGGEWRLVRPRPHTHSLGPSGASCSAQWPCPSLRSSSSGSRRCPSCSSASRYRASGERSGPHVPFSFRLRLGSGGRLGSS